MRFPSVVPIAPLILFLAALAPLPPAAAEEVEFRHEAGGGPSAIFVAGDFNNWNPSGHAMTDDDGDGVWTAVIDLPAGRYEYRFVVDGRWIEDPSAAEFAASPYGERNSIVVVGGASEKGGFVGTDEGANEHLGPPTPPAASPGVGGGGAEGVPAGDVLFSWTPESDHDAVFLAGEFNDWSPTATPMTKDGDAWTAVVNLAAGRYE